MGRRGHSTTIGKFAKIHHARRVSEIRVLGELLRREQRAVLTEPAACDVLSDGPGASHPDD
ncbi:hypothetical protein GCM10010399_54940 [Dactylosporangium fulvum]|uniref:Transposase n=1 Tax=Dactylosporangium fulvum TaxID=53359 RepID=A0ABY5WD20_9ACTN|nr:hypothetical protein [Dactylosporangium fulvum]UWP86668.1 hypothetical protein Dfulv_21485 [Dactylosporangium fulvum]